MIPRSVTDNLKRFLTRQSDALHIQALVDGLQYEQHTGQSLAPQEGAVVSLFANTEDAALAHAGPWLINPERVTHIVDLSELEQTRPSVIWLITWRDIAEQAEKLRPYLSIETPDFRLALLRFWDPRVFSSLYETFQNEKERKLFKTAFEWQYLHEGQRRYINDYAPTE